MQREGGIPPQTGITVLVGLRFFCPKLNCAQKNCLKFVYLSINEGNTCNKLENGYFDDLKLESDRYDFQLKVTERGDIPPSPYRFF